MSYLAECRVCHLLITVEMDIYSTVCAHCRPILVARAETDERLWRNRERHYNPPADRG